MMSSPPFQWNGAITMMLGCDGLQNRASICVFSTNHSDGYHSYTKKQCTPVFAFSARTTVTMIKLNINLTKNKIKKTKTKSPLYRYKYKERSRLLFSPQLSIFVPRSEGLFLQMIYPPSCYQIMLESNNQAIVQPRVDISLYVIVRLILSLEYLCPRLGSPYSNILTCFISLLIDDHIPLSSTRQSACLPACLLLSVWQCGRPTVDLEATLEWKK